LDAGIRDVECGIALLQERRTALISAAVTGQIDVRSATVADTAPSHAERAPAHVIR
jgi:hypothetical protein